MGGRGASSGISNKGRKYGTEYTSLLTVDNIKFVRYNLSTASTAPMETMTQGRVYALITMKNEVKSISYYDEAGKRFKQIDIIDQPHIIDGEKVIPHTHHGYNHNENDGKAGAVRLTSDERVMVDKVLKSWYNYIGKK